MFFNDVILGQPIGWAENTKLSKANLHQQGA